MALEKDQNPLSDTEGGEERTAREHLKKTHITHQQNAPRSEPYAANALAPEGTHSNGAPPTGAAQRLYRKRSHEEIDADSHETTSQPPRQHARKRSRDSTAEEDELNNGQRKVSGERARDGDEAVEIDAEHAHVNGTAKPPRASTPDHHDQKRTQDAAEAVASPKIKRSRLHSATVEDEDVSITQAADAEKIAESAVSDSQEDKKTEGTAKIPPTSGFANTSVTSPFGSLAGGKPPIKSPTPESQNSASAFAASGFGALSGSTTSAFGSIGKPSGGFGSGGSFATGAKSPLNTSDSAKPLSPPPSSFGGSLAQQSAFASAGDGGSGFGSGTSGFALSGNGGFGGSLGGTGFSTLGGGGLSSFASGKPIAPLGGAVPAVKPFGAPAGPEEDAKDGDDGDKTGAKSPLATEKDEQHEQFYEQVMATGEEDEVTEFTSRAKLYHFAPNPANDNKKEWRERGMGVLRLNVLKASSEQEDQKPTARLLMRADGSHRVLLNTPIKKELSFGAPTGGKPTGGYLYFMGPIDGGLELLQLKLKQANALELYEHIESLQTEM